MPINVQYGATLYFSILLLIIVTDYRTLYIKVKIHSMSIYTWRSPCDYPYPHGDLHVTHNTLHVCIHMETWRHSMSISTWRHGDTHGEMETLHVCIHMETWRHSVSVSTWRHSMSISTWRHGDTPCPYPHGDIETLHVCIHMETWRHSIQNLFTD